MSDDLYLEPGYVYKIRSSNLKVREIVFIGYNELTAIVIPIGSFIMFLGVCIHPKTEKRFSKFLYEETLIGCNGELRVDSVNVSFEKVT